jgi:hypothetical protein
VADNTTLNTGAGGDVIRDLARQGGTTKTQVVALDFGGAAANPENLINAGQDVMAQSIPVALASDQPSDSALLKVADLLTQLLTPTAIGVSSPFEQLASSIRSILQEMTPWQVQAAVSAILPALPVMSSATESSHVMKSIPGALIAITVTIGAVSGWALVFDAIAAPSDGTVTPIWWLPVDSNGTNGYLTFSWADCPLKFVNGCIAVFSTTGPFTKTASATAAFSGQVQ